MSRVCKQCGVSFEGNANQKRCNACRFPTTAVQWVAIPGYEGRYQINRDGEIRCLLKTPAYHLHPTPRPKRGYAVTLVNSEGQRSKVMVQRLVLLTFAPIADPEQYFAIPHNGNYISGGRFLSQK